MNNCLTGLHFIDDDFAFSLASLSASDELSETDFWTFLRLLLTMLLLDGFTEWALFVVGAVDLLLAAKAPTLDVDTWGEVTTTLEGLTVESFFIGNDEPDFFLLLLPFCWGLSSFPVVLGWPLSAVVNSLSDLISQMLSSFIVVMVVVESFITPCNIPWDEDKDDVLEEIGVETFCSLDDAFCLTRSRTMGPLEPARLYALADDDDDDDPLDFDASMLPSRSNLRTIDATLSGFRFLWMTWVVWLPGLSEFSACPVWLTLGTVGILFRPIIGVFEAEGIFSNRSLGNLQRKKDYFLVRCSFWEISWLKIDFFFEKIFDILSRNWLWKSSWNVGSSSKIYFSNCISKFKHLRAHFKTKTNFSQNKVMTILWCLLGAIMNFWKSQNAFLRWP